MTRFPLLFLSLGLAACAQSGIATVGDPVEAQRTAEVAAFQGADKTHGFRDAQVVFDSRNCAIYRGVAEDGEMRDVPLRNALGKPLCRR